MKRVAGFLALLLAVPAVAALAAGSGEKAAGSSAAQPAPVSVMTYMGHVATDEQYKAIHDYIEKQTGVKFTYTDVKDADSYTTQITAAIAAQQAIDLFTVGNKVSLANYRSSGAIQDITDNVNTYAPNIKKLFNNPPGWSSLPPGEMWKAVTSNGRIWAIPQASGTNVGVVLQVRKDWRVKLGLPPITTFDQFEQFLRAVK
ncbi:MAG TPA: extracellular solute-binding protein, partial [Spirochaetia bacterium]|nr:extracellular solute-binding protein [Spirochaetia bacterium]